MRVAFICADRGVPVFGSKGCSIHVQEILRAFSRRGAHLHVFGSQRNDVAPEDLQDVHVHKFPTRVRNSGAAFTGSSSPNSSSPAPANDHTAGSDQGSIGEKLDEFGPFDLCYERYSIWNAAGMEYARDHGIPGLLEVNAPLIDEQMTYRHLEDPEGAEMATRRTFNAASVIIAVSEKVRDWVASRTTNPGKIRTIPNGVDVNRFNPPNRSAQTVEPEAFTVGFVGSLKPWHGLSDLVDGFATFCQQMPRARLLIVGDGPERKRVEQQLVHAGISKHTHMTGCVPHAEIPGWLSRMDVAAATYPAHSNSYFSPLKLFEYMAAGVPVAASRVGQIPSVIQHGITGLLNEPSNPGSFAANLFTYFHHPARRKAIAENARTLIVRNHSWDSVLERSLSTDLQKGY